MGVFDVPTRFVMEAISKDLKEKNTVQSPAFAEYVKTGAHADRAPSDPDWYYSRCASLLYRVLKDGPVGTGSLRTYYGGRKNRGVKPHKHYKAGGKIIRLGLQQLEKAGLIKKNEKGGRVISPKGQKYMNDMSRIAEEAAKNYVPKVRTLKKGTRTETDGKKGRDSEKKGKEKVENDDKKKDKGGK